MSIYLGNLGRLVELKGPSSQSVSVDDGYTFEATLEKRVIAQAKTKRPRKWSVDIGAATPADLANLLAFAGGEWGKGPFVWVSADAPVTNLLTPEVSLCGPEARYLNTSTVGGPMPLGDGTWSGRSMVPETVSSTMWVGGPARVPIIPGQPVTASAWVLGNNAKVRLHWYRPDNSQIGSMVVSDGSGVTGIPRRLHVTALPPEGATGCLISTANAVQVARPAITWTDRLFDWQPGEGCQKAVLHGLSRQVLLALRDPSYGRYSNASFTVTEVG